jgi:hypothetical protein
VLFLSLFPNEVGIDALGFVGRTGRFGRKGVSINFVHDKSSYDQMVIIEKETGKPITRVDTADIELMEEVSTSFLKYHGSALSSCSVRFLLCDLLIHCACYVFQTIKKALK